MLETLQAWVSAFSNFVWGTPLLILLLGGGAYFLLASRLVPFRYLNHGWALIRGKGDDHVAAEGQISHFQALSAALSGTIGMGNIAGVALAIYVAGPGAVFWMWATAVLGIATKFFTCTLAVMYRGPDSSGQVQGGPMYFIREGLGPRWKWLASFFAIAGIVGCLPAFQTNQLVQIVRDVVLVDNGLLEEQNYFVFNLTAGIVLALVAATVILGGVQRIAGFAARMVPFMAGLYLVSCLVALVLNVGDVPAAFSLIITDAFSGEAVAGGSILAVMLYGVQRGAYSNEAGIGTEAIAHGAARTNEPVREGLVAMFGPIIDTLIICTATALMILISGVWQTDDSNGVTLTAAAFTQLLGTPGLIIIFTCVVCFALTTILTYSFYGSQCAGFLFGAERKRHYLWLYLGFILVAAVVSLDTAIGIIDSAFALMAIPTMTATLLLSPKVIAAARVYFNSLKER